MKTRLLIPAILILIVAGCGKLRQTPSTSQQEESLHHLVNPFIGTGGHGHTYPGATVPFGLVQLSPDTRLDGWDGCGGYHYSDSAIYGFSHTHLQGTGVSDYGDILFMPTNGYTRQADLWNEAWKSRFSHTTEVAEPGYYAVTLEDYGIRAELSATTRTGIHRYTFQPGDTCRLFIDFMHRDQLEYYDIQVVGDTVICGYRVSKNWAENQHCYFYAVFSQPFTNLEQLMLRHDEINPQNGRRSITYEEVQAFSATIVPDANHQLTIRVGISGTDLDGARKNAQAEARHADFDSYRREAREQWNKVLVRAPKPAVKNLSDDELTNYYTALYHCYTVPNTWSDVDHRYRGMDGQIHTAEGYTRYTVFSLWDTFRAYHPLMAELEPEITRDWIITFLEMYKERGELPVWELAANETYCMIGYHSIPVIAEAYARGIRGFDEQLALEAMLAASNGPQEEKIAYVANGYVPGDSFSESVSKTLEFAYDDYCIAMFAKSIGRDDVYRDYIMRAQNWKNVFDPATGFMRPRRNGGFPEPFDPRQVDFNYTEANSWQYSLFVPHDVSTLAAFLNHSTDTSFTANKAALNNWMNRLFEAPSETTGREQADITGLIGQYAHGNEPSHHVAWLYGYTDPAQMKQLTTRIAREQYKNAPDGLCGNEDCGQMSAWLVLAMRGRYPQCPGTTTWFDVQNSQPATPTSIDDYKVVPVPIVTGPATSFRDKATISLSCALPGAIIKVTIWKYGEPVSAFDYSAPFEIDATCQVKAVAHASGHLSSKPVMASFVKREGNFEVISTSGYNPQYTAGGDDALVDALRGGNDFRTGQWQGYQGKNIEVVVDLNETRSVSYLGLGCYQDIRPWIWIPGHVEFYISEDGQEFELAGTYYTTTAMDAEGSHSEEAFVQFDESNPRSCRYVKVIAYPHFEVVPGWHLGAGGSPWMFVDEVIIR